MKQLVTYVLQVIIKLVQVPQFFIMYQLFIAILDAILDCIINSCIVQ